MAHEKNVSGILPPPSLLKKKKKKRKYRLESIKTRKHYLSVVLFFLFICAALLRVVLLTWSCLTKKEHSFLLNMWNNRFSKSDLGHTYPHPHPLPQEGPISRLYFVIVLSLFFKMRIHVSSKSWRWKYFLNYSHENKTLIKYMGSLCTCTLYFENEGIWNVEFVGYWRSCKKVLYLSLYSKSIITCKVISIYFDFSDKKDNKSKDIWKNNLAMLVRLEKFMILHEQCIWGRKNRMYMKIEFLMYQVHSKGIILQYLHC